MRTLYIREKRLATLIQTTAAALDSKLRTTTMIGITNFCPKNQESFFNPIPTGQEQNQPLYERHVTKSGRNRVKQN